MNIKYFIYARKSSEERGRQIQSIDDQIREIKSLCTNRGIKESQIVHTFCESRSAKAPGRPVFNEMLMRISAGEANGIICYQTDRLSRNPIDSGTLQWLLIENKVKKIVSTNREYTPEDNQIVFSVDSAQSSEFIKDLKQKVKRGIKTKLEKGHAPIQAPVGYINTKFQERGTNYIKPDPERFDMVRKAWDMLLSNKYSIADIHRTMEEVWGFITKQQRTRGGKALSHSAIYRMFNDPFYCGMFRYRGELHKGMHEPMITVEEFDKAQLILGKNGKPRPRVHEFSYSGCITCGECGSAVVAIEKQKLIKSTGKVKTYILYRCSHRKGGKNGRDNGCSQKDYINVEKLEVQIAAELQKYTLHPLFCDWAMELLHEEYAEQSQINQQMYDNHSNNLRIAQKSLDSLTDMRIRDLIGDEKFLSEKLKIEDQIAKIKTQLDQIDIITGNTNTNAEKVFEFAKNALSKLENGSLLDKRSVLVDFGGNCVLLDQKLHITKASCLVPLQKYAPVLQELKNRLEPEFSLTNKSFRDNLEIYPVVRSEWDLNPRPSA